METKLSEFGELTGEELEAVLKIQRDFDRKRADEAVHYQRVQEDLNREFEKQVAIAITGMRKEKQSE